MLTRMSTTAGAESTTRPVAVLEQASGVIEPTGGTLRDVGAVTASTARAGSTAGLAALPLHVIEPWNPSVFARLQDVWRERRLIPYYGKCFIKRRYQGTWLGWLWLPLRPGLDMVSKALFFGGFLGVQSGDRPYIIFFTFGTCGWVLFQSMTRWGARAVQLSNRAIRGGYAARLPRLLGLLWTAGLDFLLYTIVAFAAVFYYLTTKGTMYLVPSRALLVACLGIGLLAAWGLSLAMLLSPLSISARDVRFSFSYLTQFWYFITPIAYPISSMPSQYQPIAVYNPLTAPVEMVKYGFLQTAPH